ncbi:branched chain amino acid ABC transporter substrate-binding protein [Desulfomarina profundi]|uniref:Branched chain amino acid ABC transporter substrate-binding protein n=2 Tax=Desulfomarina profundi TaxID=2772557 RepID=A0A8D5FSB7_9BACT|nr:branched-chain amino acid ABC transporter substrate-binding protein [Desulfomarina profundi]BCL60819.1 branched chain amino acid ABC transporter substrate-binding protein [Desulfomarina profundi]
MKLALTGKFVSTAACVLMALSLPVSGMAGDTIKLGVAGPHSGDLASYGLPSVNAAKLVVKKVNANGGINGKMVELLIEDDVCKPEIATNTATKLVTEGAQVVLGHICSGATKAALPIYNNAGILVMSPSATNPALTKSGDYPNFFRTIAPDDAQAKVDVDFALGKLGYTKIAVVHDKGDYGKGFAEFAKKFIEESGKGKVVLYEGVTPGAVDYSAIVQKIRKSGAEAVIFGGYHPEASKIVGLMKKKRLKTTFISDDGVKDMTFIKVAGKSAEGAYASGPKDNSKNPLSKVAIEEHKAEYKSDPGAFYENAYSAVLALLNAIDKAGSTDLAALKKVLQTEKVDTPVGKIYFNDKGDAIGVGFSVYKVENAKFVEVN